MTFPCIWQWVRAGKFPRAREVRGRPMWIESEVDAWIRGRPVIRYKGDADGVVIQPNSMR